MDLSAKARIARAGGGLSRERFDRSDMTAVLNALRCGMSAVELTDVVPGMSPSRLLDAYHHLDALRMASVSAWATIVDHPTHSVLAKNATLASRLLPVPIRRLMLHEFEMGAPSLEEEVASMVERVERVESLAWQLEERMLKAHSPAAAQSLGRQLYDPYESGLWGSEYFLPERVGCLTPTRVADLLGEEHS